MSFKTWIAGQHYQPGKMLPLWLWPLLPLEWGYRLGVSLRLLAYQMNWLKVYQADIPVISVGNLTTGGTGKTPIVLEIARGMIKAGKTVVILSRGYGAADPIDYGRALNPSHGDEAYMMQEQLPEAIVIVGRDRLSTLKRAVRDYRPDYVILDDGFQYRRLGRAINILLIDGSKLVGNGHMLPAGPLREPLSEIRRADLIFLTKQISKASMETVEGWAKAYGKAKAQTQVLPVEFQTVGLRPMADFRTVSKHFAPFSQFQDYPVIAFSAIAQPQSFEDTLVSQGLRLVKHFAFADHHVYNQADMLDVLDLYQEYQAERPILVTTDKDLPKVRGWISNAVQPYVYTLQMQPALDGRWFYDEFLTQMPGYVKAGKHAHTR
ncbi:MAG: tetraacyldisaccharide 4-kinase [Vampirovibrio sp.]|jgi:tetraacyldisaccharide 4'-kinase|nr:tetraacyldisaccharide 4-kinase [Vampirovibrio sp.]